MKIIFLDIDGVLNYSKCPLKSPTGCVGIDLAKLELLKEIIDATNAKIVLTSTWKTDWKDTTNLNELTADGKYLVETFNKRNLQIFDKTTEYAWSKRGHGIVEYLKNVSCESFVILDDGTFDFIHLGLDRYFVKTDYFENGLTEYHVEKAINILNNEVNKYGCKS